MGLEEQAWCPNEQCADYGVVGRGNISIRGAYGKTRSRALLYCRTCGKRFAPTRGTPFFGLHASRETIASVLKHAAEGLSVRAIGGLVGLDKDTVARIVGRAASHCRDVLRRLLRALYLAEAQVDVLWRFVKSRRLLDEQGRQGDEDESGSA